jgi:hypothetical protein
VGFFFRKLSTQIRTSFSIYRIWIHESNTRGYAGTRRFSARIRIRSSQVNTCGYLRVPVQVPAGTRTLLDHNGLNLALSSPTSIDVAACKREVNPWMSLDDDEKWSSR